MNVTRDIIPFFLWRMRYHILMRGSRLIVPNHLRPEMPHIIHFGHLGVTKCLLRAINSFSCQGYSIFGATCPHRIEVMNKTTHIYLENFHPVLGKNPLLISSNLILDGS